MLIQVRPLKKKKRDATQIRHPITINNAQLINRMKFKAKDYRICYSRVYKRPNTVIGNIPCFFCSHSY
uniref:Uncharacterized protein n=1 Tax=Rhizophora mucronata TaxID=61149 RepID=A0A2P2N6A6_RHIMU